MDKRMAEQLVTWYRNYGRDLPWRHTNDPYAIWVSEIMLQQTQVETVKPYYQRFLSTLPTIEDLAAADRLDVYKLWEGLGYYRRADHLHEAAKMIVQKYGGQFPEKYEDILSLKGIGMYTASAVSSIAFGQPKGVIDGNTLRIIARVCSLEDNIAMQKTKKKFEQKINAWIQYVNPSDFNQGMMDLGATICTPLRPRCIQCPISEFCHAYANGNENRLPVNIKKINQKTINYMTLVIRHKNRYWIVQNEEGLLQHLYGFSQYECDSPMKAERLFEEQYGLSIRLTTFIKEIKHVFTHRTWQMHIYEADLLSEGFDEDRHLYSLEEIEKLPVSTAHLKVLKAYLKAVDHVS